MVRREPYRILFPLGMVAAIVGVLLWPLWYAGWLPFYPGEAHTRMMIEGFMGAFVAGFLGTAGPRLTGSRSWFGGELVLVVVLWLCAVMCHAHGRVAAGDAVFSALLLVLVMGLAGRWICGHKDTPPPGFVLVLAGLLGALVAAGFLAASTHPAMAHWQWARLWLFQGFVLLPVMGIGPYLLPRFFGLASSHAFEAAPRPPAGWWPRALAALAAGLLVVASFALEVAGLVAAGNLLRSGVILAWFALETPVMQRVQQIATPGTAVRWALHALALGCLLAACWPMARVGALHVLFASGLALLTLTVATRVILGHAGRHDLLEGRLVWLRWVIGLLVLAAVTRMTADFLPVVRVSHHVYAALVWALGGAIWLAAMAKYLWRTADTVKPVRKCPRRARD